MDSIYLPTHTQCINWMDTLSSVLNSVMEGFIFTNRCKYFTSGTSLFTKRGGNGTVVNVAFSENKAFLKRNHLNVRSKRMNELVIFYTKCMFVLLYFYIHH